MTALAERQDSLGLGPSAVADVVVSSVQRSRPTATTYVDLQQRLGGIEIIGAILTAAVSEEGHVLGLASRFFPDPAAAVDHEPLALSALQAVSAAARALDLEAPRGLRVLEAEGTTDSGLLLSSGGIAASPIAVRLRYQPTPGGRLRLAWELEIEPEDRPHWWRVRIDAASGKLLTKIDLLDAAAAKSLRVPIGSTRQVSPPPPLADARTIVVDPSLGWQDREAEGGEPVTEEPERDRPVQELEPVEPGSPPGPGRREPPERSRERWTSRPLERW